MSSIETFTADVPEVKKFRTATAISEWTPVTAMFLVLLAMIFSGAGIQVAIVGTIAALAVKLIAKSVAIRSGTTISERFAREFEAHTGNGFPNNFPITSQPKIIPVTNTDGTSTNWLVRPEHSGFNVSVSS
jgi:hypothetical protein